MNYRTQLHQRKRSKHSLSDDWWTPLALFLFLIKKYNFNPRLDVCADSKSSLCDYWINKRTNALKIDWIIPRKRVYDIWCNPPNSLLGLFIRKAYQQWRKYGRRIMMIVPANAVSSKAWWDSIEDPMDKGQKIFYKPIKNRIKFLDNGKTSIHSARNAYMVVIWG